jgi:hypothetical protein
MQATDRVGAPPPTDPSRTPAPDVDGDGVENEIPRPDDAGSAGETRTLQQALLRRIADMRVGE